MFRYRVLLTILFTCFLLLLAYQFIPISGQILLVPENWQAVTAWPHVHLDTQPVQPGEEATVSIFDTTPWVHVKLFVEGIEAVSEGYQINSTAGVYQWNWHFVVPETTTYKLTFYHNCHTGCQLWTAVTTGKTAPLITPVPPPNRIPTKLGIVFANPERDWHNRSGWDVQLTYAQLAEDEYWGIDDLARRIKEASDNGLRVLVRVDYDKGQSIPPPNDFVALDNYLKYIRRLARDERLKSVYGYIIGSGYNTFSNNTWAPEDPVTPEWYARVFNGYSTNPEHTDNVIQTIRPENPTVYVLVGPISPWRTDQTGGRTYQIDVPWLSYFNTLVEAINVSVQAKSDIGITLVAPDGFAVQSPGHPNAPEMNNLNPADEPKTDLRRFRWGGAQVGFRVYRDWLAIINTYPHTKGLPAFITSTNTFEFETNTPPAQNYPVGWLTNAYEVVNQEPQIMALCWFLDTFPHDSQWDFFSLTNPRGLLTDAAEEFDTLLK